MADRLKNLYDSGEARSIGRTSALAIQRLNQGISPYDSGINNINNCGSLALARLLPYSLFSALVPLNYKLDRKQTKDILSITHSHKKVLSMGELINYFTQGMVHGNSAKGVAYEIINENYFLNKKIRDKIKRSLDLAEIKDKDSSEFVKEIGDSGFVEDVVYSSFYSIFRGPTFRDSVLNSANARGDSDTRASITGALYGLQTGYSRLPIDGIDNLEDSQEIIKKASELYRLSKYY